VGEAWMPAISYALPLGSENRWSGLLAVLIATDSVPLADLIGLTLRTGDLEVIREASVFENSRPDLVLRDADHTAAVLEVKVLAGLGPRQLDKYAAAVGDTDQYVVLFPERLTLDLSADPTWRPLTGRRS
jgi:hypothetical protein